MVRLETKMASMAMKSRFAKSLVFYGLVVNEIRTTMTSWRRAQMPAYTMQMNMYLWTSLPHYSAGLLAYLRIMSRAMKTMK